MAINPFAPRRIRNDSERLAKPLASIVSSTLSSNLAERLERKTGIRESEVVSCRRNDDRAKAFRGETECEYHEEAFLILPDLLPTSFRSRRSARGRMLARATVNRLNGDRDLERSRNGQVNTFSFSIRSPCFPLFLRRGFCESAGLGESRSR